MPTKAERALTKKLVSLAMDISEGGKFDACVDVRAAGIDFRINIKPFDAKNDYLFYGEGAAYFSGSPWTEKDFSDRIGVFINEANKYRALSRTPATEQPE
jgi:hypothetical protein